MKKKDIDVWKKSLSIIGQIFVPAITSSIVLDPMYAQGASTFVIQMLSLAQSEAKQTRVESLIFGLEDLLKKHDKNFNFENSNPQEVRDLLETAIVNASRASSENKIDRLRKVLFGHIVNPQSFDFASRFLDLAVRLNDDQIRILKVYEETEQRLIPLRKELSSLGKIKYESEKTEKKIFDLKSKASQKQKELFQIKKKELDKNFDSIELEYEKIINKRRIFNSSFDENMFQFLFNDMRVLGIFYNPSEGKVSNTGDSAYYQCTALGKGFIEYLKN